MLGIMNKGISTLPYLSITTKLSDTRKSTEDSKDNRRNEMASIQMNN